MERDERGTICDALTAETRALKERISALEHAIEATNKVHYTYKYHTSHRNTVQNILIFHIFFSLFFPAIFAA